LCFLPDPNVARQRKISEIWIRPVVPVNAHMKLRIASHELDQLIQTGLSAEDFAILGARKLDIAADKVRIIPIADVFMK